MLALNLARIRTARDGIEKIRFEQIYEPEAVASGTDAFSITAPVDLVFDISRDKDQFALEGRVKTTLALQCGRCLEQYDRPVELPFALRYLPRSVNAGEGEREIEEDDLTSAFYENDTIDLGQLMREQFYLALPMKPLCSDECRGLCPQCGTNLNHGACGCTGDWVDPRLAALSKLKNNLREH
jgi:DUF177 domain-containing protein